MILSYIRTSENMYMFPIIHESNVSDTDNKNIVAS
mgnify:CR=1 FL=1